MSRELKRGFSGYTLSEILIALAILGVCMSVAIPMMAQSREKSLRTAVLKEAVQMLYGIEREGMATDELRYDNFKEYYLQRINAIKYCRTSSDAEGCWDPVVQGSATNENPVGGGVILANGAAIVGMNNFSEIPPSEQAILLPAFQNGQVYNGILIDWNGIKKPNVLGEDQLHIMMCFGVRPCLYAAGVTQQPGTVAPLNLDVNNVNLFKETFK
jgi:prepilin-type N-terminal cleavage/methylation domain-containing protein